MSEAPATGPAGARPAQFIIHSGATSIGDDDLYVHLFRGGRITVAGASGRVWLQGVLRAASPLPRAPASVRYVTTDGAALDVPFPSPTVARLELQAAERALRAPGAVLGEGQQGAPDLPPSPALPTSRPPLASMLAAPLKHITLPPASPEIALHLLRALRAVGDGPAGEAGFPAGYIEVDLPDDTWVLYRHDGEGAAEEAGEAAEEAAESAGEAAAQAAQKGGEAAGQAAQKVYAVPGPLPMLVWRRGRPPSPQDRMALMERLRAAAAPLMRSWADPVLCPPVPAAGAAVFGGTPRGTPEVSRSGN